MPNKLTQFWQELKRRRVIHVIVVYASATFVILELINNITGPLNLPDWTPTLVIVILLIGFPLVVIFSWIFDVTPEGIEKTKPFEELHKSEQVKVSGSWRIATYVSIVIIIGLILINILAGRRGPRIDESLRKSIAVLVFQNLSGDESHEYICVGLTDEIISNLFKVASFDEVRSLTSVKQFQNSELSIKEIAQELQVNYILEGTYKRMGDELKITAQLIEPRSDNHIWIKDYELPYNKIMGIPGNIALQIAGHLKAFLSEDEQQSIDRIPTDNIEAYELMQQAVDLFNSGFVQNRYQLRELAKSAIELDPDYASPYAIVGLSLVTEGFYGGDKEMQSVAWEAEVNIEKALEIDPLDLLANYAMCALNWWVKWDYVKVDDILSTFPNIRDNEIYNIGASQLFYLQMGQYETTISLFSEDSFEEYAIKSRILLGESRKANEMLNRRIVELGSKNYPIVGELFILLQDFDKALYYLESATESEDNAMLFPRFQADLGVAYYKSGYKQKARNTISKIVQRSDTTASQSPAFFLGWYYGWIGELDSAFFWLEKAFENRSPEIPWLKVDPAFNSLKEDPRYWDLYERTGHKAFDDYLARKNQ